MLHVNSWRVCFAFLFDFMLKFNVKKQQWTRLSMLYYLWWNFMRHTWIRCENRKKTNVIGRLVGWLSSPSYEAPLFQVNRSVSLAVRTICFLCENPNIFGSIKIALPYDCDGMKQIVANVSNHIFTKKVLNKRLYCNLDAWNEADASG